MAAHRNTYTVECLKSHHQAHHFSITRDNPNIVDLFRFLPTDQELHSRPQPSPIAGSKHVCSSGQQGDGLEMTQPIDSRGVLARQVAAAPFGPRLRMERERRRITLESIAANTKISLGLLKDLEQDNVSRWPSGIFRRAFIKAYAQAIGLDPDDLAREFLERFPDQETFGPFQEDRPTAEPRPAAAPAGFRLTLVQPEATFTRDCILRAVRGRVSAVAWDVGVVLVISAILFVLLGQFWRPLGIFVLGYYASGIFLLGNTPGVCLFAASRSRHRYGDSGGSTYAAAKSAGVKTRMMALIKTARPARLARRTEEDDAEEVNAK
jgi:transcriptional regulator with XRE-family HTH domain